MNRLDFMNCPCCSGHEKIGADTAVYLESAIDGYLNTTCALPEHVRGELQNIVNVLRNSTEFRVEPGRSVDDDPLLA